MNDLIRDTLSQIIKVVFRDEHIIIFFNPKTNKQLFIDCVLFHFRDKENNEYGHSSVLQSEKYKIGLRSIIFKPNDTDAKRAKQIFFYIHTGKVVNGMLFPIEK